MSLLKRTYFRDYERICVRIVALMYVFLVGVFPGVATFISSNKASEETDLLSTERPPANAQSRAHYRGGGGKGMSYIYYIDSCPRAYDVVRERVQFYISQDPSQAAGILRIFFQDCFVQGCDASLLLERPEGSERSATSDLNSLRATSVRIINEIKASLEVACPGVVSCADTLALAARDAIFMVGGPWIPILTGRKDSIVAASNQTVMASVPVATLGFSELKRLFASKGLSVKDLVALSGAHTIGQTHCGLAVSQLTPTISRDLSPAFGANLSQICLAYHPAARKSHLTVHLDSLTPDSFDNAYFKNVLKKQAIFHSDAALLDDNEGLSYVHSFALSQAQFFKQFHLSFLKMSQIGVLTNVEGEVRMSCGLAN